MLLDQPLARATSFRPVLSTSRCTVRRRCAVVAAAPPASRPCGIRWCGRERRGPARAGDDGADQPLRLAQGQAEHGPQGERRQDRQRRVPGLPARVVRGAARHPSIAASENHTVRLPRWHRLASYSRQFITFRFCLGMRWRRSWFSLNGKMDTRGSDEQGRSSYVGPTRSATGRIHATEPAALDEAEDQRFGRGKQAADPPSGPLRSAARNAISVCQPWSTTQAVGPSGSVAQGAGGGSAQPASRPSPEDRTVATALRRSVTAAIVMRKDAACTVSRSGSHARSASASRGKRPWTWTSAASAC